jgi:hypothetical protein
MIDTTMRVRMKMPPIAGEDEDAADRRHERHGLVGDVLLGVRQHDRVQEPPRRSGRCPGHDREHLPREAADRGEEGRDQHHAENDKIEDGDGH